MVSSSSSAVLHVDGWSAAHLDMPPCARARLQGDDTLYRQEHKSKQSEGVNLSYWSASALSSIAVNVTLVVNYELRMRPRKLELGTNSCSARGPCIFSPRPSRIRIRVHVGTPVILNEDMRKIYDRKSSFITRYRSLWNRRSKDKFLADKCPNLV